MEEFEKLKNKFKKSNKYMLTLDYEEIKRLIEITENLIARNKELKEENRKLRKCHLQYEEMTGIDLLLED